MSKRIITPSQPEKTQSQGVFIPLETAKALLSVLNAYCELANLTEHGPDGGPSAILQILAEEASDQADAIVEALNRPEGEL